MECKVLSDDDLEESFRLRYEVYCKQKGFIQESECPAGIEHDEYDGYSIHIGAFNDVRMIGTIRIITSEVLPISAHCNLDIDILPDPVAEISRLALDKNSGMNRSESVAVVMGMYRLLYKETINHGFKYWAASMEKSLAKALRRNGFHFTRIGPMVDYYGDVGPYVACLRHIQSDVMEANPELYDFMES